MKQILNSHDISRWRERLRQTGLLPEAMVAEGNFFRFERDEILIRQGEVPLCLFCTLTGVTEVQSFLPNGRTLTVNTFRSPSLIGELELIDAEHAPLQVRAKTDGILFSLNMERAKEIGLSDVDFLRKLCVIICRKERESNMKLVASRGYEAEIRFARLILDSQTEGVFTLRRVDVAGLLGVSYRHTGNLFSSFFRRGWLQKEGRCFRISDMESLRRLADQTDG